MNDINELKNIINTKTLNFLLLTVVTLGIYPLMWIHRNHKVISKITKISIFKDSYTIIMAVCVGLESFSGLDIQIDLLLIIPEVVLGVFYVMFALNARKALQAYALNKYNFKLKMNYFYTIIFSTYYINYCINDLPNALNKHQLLQGNTAQQ
ncbi:DUF4234 domain-containing protein [Desulfovibrio sp. UCD-KL4C]|uniref:DUF4234 domain-containing protein n=1 Tax=Desulfovibrio sp. UCD-KL4C TaxID=2578120 RepID=UPI0025BF720D|nr:DUF4234 domain-containing protein [Desulfovibrio sp. UCD-KL4C]